MSSLIGTIEQLIASLCRLAEDCDRIVVVRIEDEQYPLAHVERDQHGVRIWYGRGGARSYSTRILRAPRPCRNGLSVLDEDDEKVQLLLHKRRVTHGQGHWNSQNSDRHEKLIGQRFGHLTVVEIGGWIGRNRAAHCECACGGQKVVRISSLRAGHTISCGCRRGKNRELPLAPGTPFGRLTVITQVERPEGETRNEGYYRVRCSCGQEVVRRRELLVCGKAPDCGCRGRGELVGQRFGMVTILGDTRRENRHRKYLVRCDCGREAWLRINDLRTGKAKSCGCARGQAAAPR